MLTDLRVRRHAEPPHPGEGCEDLPLFRFGLRQLLFFVAVVSLLLGAVVLSRGSTAIALLMAAAVVILHLFSTALGSQLRWHANRTLAHTAMRDETNELTRRATSRFLAVTPWTLSRSPWHRRGSTPLPWVPRLVVAMSLLGGAAGAVLLAATIGYRTSLAGILLGSFSIAVMMGWFAFLAGSFYGIFRHGFREAVAEHKKDGAQVCRTQRR